VGSGVYDFRARVWSPELAAFLQADEFGFLGRSGTLWSWPGQNPIRWRDPTGRGAAEDWAGQFLDAAAEFSPTAGGAANDNGFASEVEAAESETPLGLAATDAAVSLGIFASQVQALAQEMFEQQDADANAIARAAAAARPAAGGAGEPPDCGKKKGGIGPVNKGQQGVERAIREIEAEGGRVIGREITVQANGTTTRPDLLFETAEGELQFGEVKNGPSAGLTPNQNQGFPGIRAGGAIPVGANAAAAGLTPGSALPPMAVRMFWY
jgi:hypothetical protein